MPAHAIPDRDTVRKARQAGEALAELENATPGILRLRDRAGRIVEINVPGAAVEALGEVLETIGKGHAVRVLADDEELTTNEAADLLHVSRPHLVTMLERGDLPFRRVGAHRRIRLADVLAFKRREDDARRAALDELTGLSDELGLYD
ncbi:MAG: excisionase family DNA-binding protein [Pseudomonadota bacterium]|nr:excisionase family DNA-binding protein [Pseudomonadota bacterium]